MSDNDMYPDRLTRMSLRRRFTLGVSRWWRKLHPANATCNNDWCHYRGRRTRRGIWCPACYEDVGGELIRDTSEINK